VITLRTAIIAFMLLGLAACQDCSGTPPPLVSDSGAVSQIKGDGGNGLCAALTVEERIDKSRIDCLERGAWAWALRVDPGDGGIVQTLIVAGDKTRARQTSNVAGVEWPPALGRHSALFDFDGDGVPEFFAVVPADVKTFTPAVRNLVTFKGGAIAPYPIPDGWIVEGVSDVDGDGRGDLRVAFDLGKRTICEPSDEPRIALDFVAHGLANGTFTLSDDVAVAQAAKKCPPTSEMFAPSISQALEARDLSLGWVSCARVRGKSEAAVIAELQTACKASDAATKACKGPCRHLPDALVVAKFAPPVQTK
jgi:hypothetical protein